MKTKTTKKFIRENYSVVLAVGYCDIQYITQYIDADYYITRAEGWGSDIYICGDVTISTGYDPIGEHVPYDICCKWDEAAKERWNHLNVRFPYANRKTEATSLLLDFVRDALYSIGDRQKRPLYCAVLYDHSNTIDELFSNVYYALAYNNAQWHNPPVNYGDYVANGTHIITGLDYIQSVTGLTRKEIKERV